MILSGFVSRVGIVSILAFLCLLSWCISVWQQGGFVDEHIWLERVSLQRDNLSGASLDPSNFLHSNSPGLVILSIAAVAKDTLNVSLWFALIFSVSLLVTSSAVLASRIAYLMYPREIWWLVVFVTIGFHYSLLRSTPPSIVAGAINPLLVLYGLYVWKKPERLNLAVFGIITAVSLFTRWPAGIIISTPLWVALFFRLKIARLIPGLVAGGVTSVIIAPFIISDPVGLFQIIFLRSFLNFDHEVNSSSVGLLDLLSKMYLMLISMSLAVILLFQSGCWKKILFPVLLLITSALYISAFKGIAAESLRHWYPLIISWEVLLPYWIINLTSRKEMRLIAMIVIVVSQLTAAWVIF
jgi:hypothetical protein